MNGAVGRTGRSLRGGTWTVAVVCLSSLVLGGCGSDDDAGSVSSSGSGSSAPASSSGSTAPDPELTITVVSAAGATSETTLSCTPQPTGSVPDPAGACTQLAGLDDPFAPVAPDAICTQVFGGDQTARIEGVWQGQPVDLALSRTDGCRISQWDRFGPALLGQLD
jgi:hypothetical protein